MNLRFSIITVCYNSEKTIEKTIKSLLNQNYKNYEYIVVDGESNDSTLEIVNRYKSKFKNIKIISEKDKGIYDAMNKGINLCNGELIGFLNSDDYYEPNALELISNNYTKDIDVIFGDTYLIDYYKEQVFEKRAEIYPIDKLKEGKMIPHTSTFVKSNLMKENNFDINYRIASDYKLILKLYKDNKIFKYIPYRINNMVIGGISTTENKKLLTEFSQCQKDILSYSSMTEGEINRICLKMKIKNIIGKKLLTSNLYIKLKYINRGWKLV